MKLLRHILTLLLCTALLGPLYASAAGDRVYPDVPVDHWAEEVVSKAGDYGLMQGREDGTFGLGRNLSRAEFVTMLSRMFGWTGGGMGQTYADVPPDKWYYEVVEQAAAAGVAEAGETFRPEEAITRREMAGFADPRVKEVRIMGGCVCIEVHDAVVLDGFKKFAYDRGVFSRPFLRYMYAMVPYVIEEEQLVKILDTMKAWFRR